MQQNATIELKKYLFNILQLNSSENSNNWLKEKLTKLQAGFSEKDFYLTFSLLPRFFGKEKVQWTVEQIQQAEQLRKGFYPEHFSLVQLARIYWVLQIPADDAERYLKILNNLFTTGEIQELVALYSALPLLPHPELLKSQAAEGVRTNMTVVYDAVALHNPYPSEYLDDDAWNQLVLKAVFIERPLANIYGLDQRTNPQLARMLSDYAHERWAASRYVTPELWRPVAPYINTYYLNDFERLLDKSNELDKQAAALALSHCDFPDGKKLLSNFPELLKGLEEKSFSWKSVSEKWFEIKNATV